MLGDIVAMVSATLSITPPGRPEGTPDGGGVVAGSWGMMGIGRGLLSCPFVE